MKCFKTAFFVLTLFASISAQIDTNSQHYYMFIYFVQGAAEQAMGARLALSTDAVTWEKYNNETPIIVPHIATGEVPLMRDPNILYDPNDGIFHMTWTTAWNQDNVGYASSKDLISWSDQVMITVGQKINGCKVCWAPEFISMKDSVMLYWSTDRGICGKEPFYSMTKDFKHYTTPKTFFSPKTDDGNGYSIIDDNLLKIADNKYYLFFKDERSPAEAGKQSQNIHFVFGPTPIGPWWKGPWDDVSQYITPPGYEGPTSIIIGDEVRVYSDPFMSHTSTDRTRVVKLASLMGDSAPPVSAFTPGPKMKTIDSTGKVIGDFLPSHGSISEIPRAKFMHVLYGTPDNTTYSRGWHKIKQSDISVVDALPPPEILAPGDTDGAIQIQTRVYPMSKQNTGCGMGVGLAFIPPIFYKGMAIRRRRKQKAKAK